MSARAYTRMLVAFSVGCVLFTTTAQAQITWYVDDDAPGDPGPGDPLVSDPDEDGSAEHPFDAIQEGIDAAVPGDTVLVLDGTYTGAGNKNLDYDGKDISVRSENGPANCIIDCEGSGRGFYLCKGETENAVIDGLTVTGGNATTASIDCRLGSRPMIMNCIVTGNVGLVGGGITCGTDSDSTIVNCVVVGNTATNIGGGLRFYACSPTIVNCTIADNTAANGGGGVLCVNGASPAIVNCVVWGNSAPTGSQIALHESSVLVVSYCDVQGGAAAASLESGCVLTWGDGNIDADPLFVDPDGPDDDPNTWGDNDYRLNPGSSCIDAADNTAVPLDTFDLDEDGDTDERTPFDLDGNPRFVQDPFTDDTGVPDPPLYWYIVDMGAYEYQFCHGDLDDDGYVGLSDLAQLLSWFGGCIGPTYYDGDLDRDGDVDLADLAELLGLYGMTCE